MLMYDMDHCTRALLALYIEGFMGKDEQPRVANGNKSKNFQSTSFCKKHSRDSVRPKILGKNSTLALLHQWI